MRTKPNNHYSELFWKNITLWRVGEAGPWDGAPMEFRRTALKAADYLQATTFMANKLGIIELIMKLDTDEQIKKAFTAVYTIVHPDEDKTEGNVESFRRNGKSVEQAIKIMDVIKNGGNFAFISASKSTVYEAHECKNVEELCSLPVDLQKIKTFISEK